MSARWLTIILIMLSMLSMVSMVSMFCMAAAQRADASPGPEPVARLIRLCGPVSVAPAGGAAVALPRTVMTRLLQAGDVIRVGAGARAQLVHPGARARYVLDAGCAVRVTAASVTSLAPGHPPKSLPSLPPVPGELRAVPDDGQRLTATITRAGGSVEITPFGAVRSATPRLEWKIAGDAADVKRIALKICDVTGVRNAAEGSMVFNPPLESTAREVLLPEGILCSGRHYLCTLTVTGYGTAGGEASIPLSLLSSEALAGLRAREAAIAGAGLDAYTSALLRALLFRDHALYSEALARLDEAQRAAADQALPLTVARGELYAHAGMMAEAEAAYDLALEMARAQALTIEIREIEQALARVRRPGN